MKSETTTPIWPEIEDLPSSGPSKGLAQMLFKHKQVIAETLHWRRENGEAAEREKSRHLEVIKQAAPKKEFTLIVSSMRAGSTLLKALLAQAPGFSHIPERDFQMRGASAAQWYDTYEQMAPENHIILKHPCGFTEADTYPLLPPAAVKVLVLYREPTPTVRSLAEMLKATQTHQQLTAQDLLSYWCMCYEGILARILPHSSVCFIAYEDLVRMPREVTKRLFEWLGQHAHQGVDSYTKPAAFEWRWGADDGGAVIQSLQVQAPLAISPEVEELTGRINALPRVAAIRERFESLTKLPLA